MVKALRLFSTPLRTVSPTPGWRRLLRRPRLTVACVTRGASKEKDYNGGGNDDDDDNDDGVAEAKNAALRLLSYRPYSKAELTTKLQDRFSATDLEEALLRLEEVGLQSDREVASVFVREKWRVSKWSPTRVRHALVQLKGVDEQTAEMALEEIFGKPEEAASAFEGWGRDVDDIDIDDDDGGVSAELWQAVSRKWRGMRSVSSLEAKQRRMLGWLQRRGFSWSASSRYTRMCVERLEENEDSIH